MSLLHDVFCYLFIQYVDYLYVYTVHRGCVIHNVRHDIIDHPKHIVGSLVIAIYVHNGCMMAMDLHYCIIKLCIWTHNTQMVNHSINLFI